jgi:hypothetical protein
MLELITQEIAREFGYLSEAGEIHLIVPDHLGVMQQILIVGYMT